MFSESGLGSTTLLLMLWFNDHEPGPYIPLGEILRPGSGCLLNPDPDPRHFYWCYDLMTWAWSIYPSRRNIKTRIRLFAESGPGSTTLLWCYDLMTQAWSIYPSRRNIKTRIRLFAESGPGSTTLLLMLWFCNSEGLHISPRGKYKEYKVEELDSSLHVPRRCTSVFTFYHGRYKD